MDVMGRELKWGGAVEREPRGGWSGENGMIHARWNFVGRVKRNGVVRLGSGSGERAKRWMEWRGGGGMEWYKPGGMLWGEPRGLEG